VIQSVLQLNVKIQNAPSMLAKVGDKLRAADVNINAISCSEGNPHTIIHLIVDDPETAKIALSEIAQVHTKEVLVIQVKNDPGAIAFIGRACAVAGINIHNIYATTVGKGKESVVYVDVDNLPLAMEKMKTAH
jgi:hypothetical protein